MIPNTRFLYSPMHLIKVLRFSLLLTVLLLTPLADLCSSFHLFQSCINPIFLLFLPFSPECSALAFFASAISRSNLA